MPSGCHHHRRWEEIVAVVVDSNIDLAFVDVPMATHADLVKIDAEEHKVGAYAIAEEGTKIEYLLLKGPIIGTIYIYIYLFFGYIYSVLI